jgi:dTDP-glucose pyrophosphorylase
MINKYLVKKNSSLLAAMQKVDKSGTRSLIVVDNNNKLLGTLTDGDIRRSILKKNDLSGTIESIYFKKPAYVLEKKFSKKLANEIFEKKNCDIIPVIDGKKIVKDIILSKNFNAKKISAIEKKIAVVIMAGGYGVRLKPFTTILPKPLIPIKGKAVIEHLLDLFTLYGFNKFNLLIHYKQNIIKSYLKSVKPNIKFNFVEEKNPLGTAGGLKLLKKNLTNDFIVTYSDTIFDLNVSNFISFHKKNKFKFSMVVTKKDYKIPYGVCAIDSRGMVKKINEKPSYNLNVNSGLYAMNSDCLKYIPKNGVFHVTDLIKKLLKNKIKIGAYFVPDSSIMDVGQWNDFNKVNLKE